MTYYKATQIVTNDFGRDYLVNVPKGYTPDSSYPLVVVIHGTFSTGEEMEDVTGFSDLADREEFIVLYPNGIEIFGLFQHWNAVNCCGKTKGDRIDDIGYLEKSIMDISSRLNIDKNRIYMTGFSNGGMLTYRFAAEKSHIIAAAAPLADSIGGKTPEEKKNGSLRSLNILYPS